MLIFLAPDIDRLPELEQAVRLWLAWTSIQDEQDHLDLGIAQKRQVEQQIKNMEDTITERIRETFCHLLVPTQEGTGAIEWRTSRLQGDNLVVRASRKLITDQEVITSWSPALLRIELDKWLWKDQAHLSVRQLWEYLALYLYLPRLKDEQVLIGAIRDGVGSITWKDFFAYAAGVREDGRYVGLAFGVNPVVNLDAASVLVKPDVAQKQRDEEAAAEEGKVYTQPGETQEPSQIQETAASGVVLQPAVLRRFHGSVELDPARMGRDAGRIADEVLAHLTGIVGAKAKITLEIDVEVPNGIPEDKVRIVNENANTLKFKGHGFEEG